MPDQSKMAPDEIGTVPKICDDLILLSPKDNVLVVRRTIQAKTSYWTDTFTAIAPEKIEVGYKVARYHIPSGQKILKYGAPIGSATQNISAGDVVHINNMKSDYLPTYTHDADNYVDRGANK